MRDKNAKHTNKSIFITGLFRSGTTLVSKILSAHPQIAVAYQLLFPFFKMWRDLFFEQIVSDSVFCNNPMGSNILFEAGVFDIFGKSQDKVYFSGHDLGKLETLLTEEAQEDKREKPIVFTNTFAGLKKGNAGEILFQLLCRVRDICGENKEIIGFKEIWCEDFIPALLKLKKTDIKGIQVLRDPRGVFASRNTGRYIQQCGGKKYPLLFVVESWQRSTRIAAMLADNQSFYCLRYEDIIEKPEQTVKNLCSFLDIHFSEDMINPHKFVGPKGNLWNPNTTGDSFSPSFNKERASYWQEALSDKEIGSIEFLCEDQIHKLGYEKKFDKDKSRELFMSYSEKEQDIHPWLRKFKYTCDEQRKRKEIQLWEKAS